MFASLFIVCNLMTGQCGSVAADYVYKDMKMCNMAAEVMRQEALSELGNSAIIMYKCVEFPEAL